MEPFPDRDSVQQLLYPILNYLTAATSLGNDFSFLSRLMFDGLPTGILLIPWFITAMDLGTIFIASPWLLNLFLVIPLTSIFWLAPVSRERRWAFIFLVFFFPPIQLTLKNLNLHSFVIIYCLAGIFMIMAYRRSGNKVALTAALLSFTFACSVKHLGLIIFLTLWICYLLWLQRRAEPLQKAVFSGLFVVLGASYFYPVDSMLPYFNALMRQSPNIKPMWIYLMSASMIFLFLFGWFQAASESSGRIDGDENFAKPWPLITVSVLTIFILCMGSDFFAPLWMLVSFVLGNGVLLLFLRWRQFDGERGYLILSFLFTFIVALVLYFSKLGHVSALFVLPIIILLLLYVMDAKKNTHLGMLLVCFLVFTNFFPSLNQLESIMGAYGFNLYSRGFNMLHQNPLGWERSKVLAQRKLILEKLTSLSYQEALTSLIVSRSGAHHHQIMELLTPEQLFKDVPPTMLMEDLSVGELREFYARYLKKPADLYRKMAVDGKIAIIFEGPDRYAKYEHSELPQDLPDAGGPREAIMFSAPMVNLWFHKPYLNYLKSENLLQIHYNRFSLGPDAENLTLFIHKKFRNIDGGERKNLRLASLERDYLDYLDPRRQRSREYWAKADSYLKQGKSVEAYVYLKTAFKLTPNDEVIKNDLEIITRKLGQANIAKLDEQGLSKLLNILEENQALPWSVGSESETTKTDPINEEELEKRRAKAQELFSTSAQFFQTSPLKAVAYLKQVLELDPNHESAREDLDLLLLQQKKDEAKKIEIQNLSLSEKADLLFQESVQYFEQNPAKAKELLSQVLKIDPDHSEAIADFKALEDRENLALLSPDKIKAESLFQEANQLFAVDQERAMEILKQVLEMNPEHEEAARDIQILEQNKNRNRAQVLYHESLQYQAENPRKAVSILEEVLRLDPDHAVGRNALKNIQAYLSTDSLQKAVSRNLTSQASMMIGTNPSEAEKILKRALKLDAANEEARDQLRRLETKKLPNP